MQGDTGTNTVKSLCRLFGISRQGYYKHDSRKNETDVLSSSIVHYCNYIRRPDNLPKSGCRELYALSKEYFKDRFVIGRDRFYDILRSNGLMLRKKKYHPRTTDSKHGYRIYDDLLNTTPKYVPAGNGRLVVSDITYVYTNEGFAYLSLITDAYSRFIVGYSLHRTLDTGGPLAALRMALNTYRSYGIDVRNMIHHSDRGVQYASREYTDMLRSNNIRISMTQTGDPLHNALAERMNNTLKNSWLFNNGELTFEETGRAIDNAVRMYNEARPHSSIGMRTPRQVISGEAKNVLVNAYME